MEKLVSILKSRTVWAVIVLFLVAGFEGVQQLLPENLVVPVEALLALLATYFRVNPKQEY